MKFWSKWGALTPPDRVPTLSVRWVDDVSVLPLRRANR